VDRRISAASCGSANELPPPGSYIRGKSWELAAQVFKRFDQKAFEEIESALKQTPLAR
jgi:hypothetical protein